LNARTAINEQQAPSVNVSKMFNIKTGSTFRTDSGHQHSVDDKILPVRLMMLIQLMNVDELDTDVTFGIGRAPSFRDETEF